MPYKLVTKGTQTCVVNETTGKEVPGGCHATKAEAVDHLRALYKNVPDARPSYSVEDGMTNTMTTGAGGGFHATTSIGTGGGNGGFFPSQPEPRGSRFRLYFVEGERTVDNRVLDPNCVNFNRPPPFALGYQRVRPAEGGHAGSEIAGVIESVMRDGLTIVAEGRLDLSPEGGKTVGDEVERLIKNRILQTWSPDLSDATVDIEQNVLDEDGQTPQESLAHFVQGTFNGGVLVGLPALASAVVELLAEDGTVLVPAPSRETLTQDAVRESHDPEEQKVIVDRTDEKFDITVNEDIDPEFTAERVEDELWALSMVMTTDELAERNFPTALRKKYAKQGIAMKDGSFPIPDKDALRRAKLNIGHAPASKRAAVIAHINKRARALGEPGVGQTKKKIAASVEDILTACAGHAHPPVEFFTDPELPALQRWVTITADGRIYGHAADNGTECHIGYMDRCVTSSFVADGIEPDCNFEYAMPGHVVCADGTKIGTGPIAIKGGHAQKGQSWREALSHYDDPSAAVADVVYGRDSFGIWFSGALRSTVTEEDIHTLRASGVSMDAREIGGKLRYLATCSVNTPGFPKVQARLLSSAEDAEPELLTLIAAGGAPESAYDHDDTCDCSDHSDWRKEIEALKLGLEASGVLDAAFDKLSEEVLATLPDAI